MRRYTVEEIREAMSDRVISVVAEKTGIHSNTLYRIMLGKQNDMHLGTYNILVDYLFGSSENRKIVE